MVGYLNGVKVSIKNNLLVLAKEYSSPSVGRGSATSKVIGMRKSCSSDQDVMNRGELFRGHVSLKELKTRNLIGRLKDENDLKCLSEC